MSFPQYLPTECFCQYITTELGMEKFLRWISPQNTDEKKLSVIPFIFVEFLVHQSTRFGNSFVEQLLENWQTMEIGVWRFLPSRCCGIGRPRRSFSFSINKGEPIFICSVLDFQVFGTWMYRYCPLFMWCWIYMELKVHLQVFPHKSERWKHGSINFQIWHFCSKSLC